MGEERKNYSGVVRALLEEGYKREIEKLHASYSRGEITLRGMARRLGLNYRELYQLLADKGLPLSVGSMSSKAVGVFKAISLVMASAS